MGSGKTTLGKKLALELKIPFIDSDAEIEKISGKSIAEIFAQDGEEAFRKLETEFIAGMQAESSFVLSTGGGMPCFNNNIDHLNHLGLTIYLKNSSENLADRLIEAKNERPLIHGKSKEELIEFIEINIQRREEYYNQAKLILQPDQQGIVNVYKLVHSF